MPMASPTRAGSSPPGYLRASRANTGNTRNRPSIRSAKISARLRLERRSCGVMALPEGDGDRGGGAAPASEEGESGTVVPYGAGKAGIFAHWAGVVIRVGMCEAWHGSQGMADRPKGSQQSADPLHAFLGRPAGGGGGAGARPRRGGGGGG